MVKILYVDDEQWLRNAMKRILRSSEVLLAPNGPEGLRMYREHQTNIGFILTDNSYKSDLKPANGLEFLRVLSENYSADQLPPRLMITGDYEIINDLHTKVQQYGGLGAIDKPADAGLIRTVAAELLDPKNNGRSTTLEDYFKEEGRPLPQYQS